MRPSAEIGSEKITRSMRVRRANSTRSSTEPSFWRPATVVGARSSPRSSNRPTMCTSLSRCARMALIRISPPLIGAYHDSPAVEPALLGPPPHQQEQGAAESDQGRQAEDVEAAEPHPRELVSRLGEERHADGNQEDHRPRRGEPHILLLVAAKRLHLVDIGHLQGQHRHEGDHQDAGHVVPLEALDRHHIGAVDRGPDQHRQRELDQAHGSGEHNRRISRHGRLGGNVERGGRQRLGGLGKSPPMGGAGRSPLGGLTRIQFEHRLCLEHGLALNCRHAGSCRLASRVSEKASKNA